MEKKRKTVNAYLIKNSKGEGGWGGRKTKTKQNKQTKNKQTNKQQNGGRGGNGWRGVGGGVGRQSEGLGRVVWVYKTGLK